MSNGQPDEKILPDAKKEAHKQDLGKKVGRTLTDAYREMRRHEVSRQDAREIVEGGRRLAGEHYHNETEKE